MSEFVVVSARRRGGRVVEAQAVMVTVAGAANPVLFFRDDMIRSIEGGRDVWRVGVVREKHYGEYGRDVLEVDRPIHVVEVGGEKFLRVDDRKVREDDLGGLPETLFEVASSS